MWNIHSHWQNAKRVIGDSWHGAVKLAGQIDRGMNVGRRLVGALNDSFGGGGHMKALEAGSGADAVAASKTTLRNITDDARIDAATTPDALKALNLATLLGE